MSFILKNNWSNVEIQKRKKKNKENINRFKNDIKGSDYGA
jgi:hypothetical protein